MSFLAPLFLAGSLAIGLPIVFHLIRRHTQTAKPFSSLRFLDASPPVMVQKRRLEDILLLLLRCLAIALVAFGFARPFIDRQLPIAPASGNRVQRILLVDVSASMRREGVWTAAMQAAQRWASKSIEDEFAMLSFDRGHRQVIGFDEWRAAPRSDRAVLGQARLASLRPSWASTSLDKALLAAVELLQEQQPQAADAATRQIVVISDLQQGARLDGLQGFEWPKNLEVTFESVAATEASNASLHWLAESATVLGRESRARVRVRNAADSKVDQFRLAYTDASVASAPPAATRTTPVPTSAAAAKPAGALAVTTPPPSSAADGTMVYVPPGQSRAIDAPSLPAGMEAGRLLLSGDKHDFDNAAVLLKPSVEVLRVVYLGSEKPADAGGVLFYMHKAFNPSTWPQFEVLDDPAKATPALMQQPAPVLAVVATEPGQEAAANLRRFADAGGIVIWLLRQGGAAAALPAVTGIENLAFVEAPAVNYFMLASIDFEHPLFKPFSDGPFSDFRRVYFWKHRRPEAKLPSAVRVVARFDDGEPAVLDVPVGKGRVVILTSTWAPQDSQWARSTKFVPFLYSFVELSGKLVSRWSQHVVGDVLSLPDYPGERVLEKPDRSRTSVAPNVNSFTDAEQPGLYRFVAENRSSLFAVNLDPNEGRTEPMPVEELEKLGVPVKHQEAAATGLSLQQQAARSRQVSEAEQKFWRWCLAVGLGVLLLETTMASWISVRRNARTPETAV